VSKVNTRKNEKSTVEAVNPSTQLTNPEIMYSENNACLMIPLGPGEVLDRLTVLRLKAKAARTEHQAATIALECDLLSKEWRRIFDDDPQSASEWAELLETNSRLWNLENDVRTADKRRNFDNDFIEAARAIFKTNDRRAMIKSAINNRLGSSICDFKFHEGDN
jgi:hypothetical protein